MSIIRFNHDMGDKAYFANNLFIRSQPAGFDVRSESLVTTVRFLDGNRDSLGNAMTHGVLTGSGSPLVTPDCQFVEVIGSQVEHSM